jgi:hypothetical protein
MMFVCYNCHEADKDVTGCKIPFYNHPNRVTTQCDICGHYGIASHCIAYRILKDRIRKPSNVHLCEVP